MNDTRHARAELAASQFFARVTNVLGTDDGIAMAMDILKIGQETGLLNDAGGLTLLGQDVESIAKSHPE